MKKIFTMYAGVAMLVLLPSCNDDFLERYPLSTLSPETYFSSESELKAYTNAFYNQLPEALNIFYDAPFYADDDARTTVHDELRGVRIVPTSGGGWSWTELRRINFFLENSGKFPDQNIRNKYDGLARFFRAWFYFEKLKRFGDVPWYDGVLSSEDEALSNPRDTREFVFSKIMEDLDFAIQHLDAARSVQLVTKWTALALKSRAALFEGTFRKYHSLGNYEAALRASAEASAQLISESGYSVYKSSPEKAYLELFIPDKAIAQEMILAREYSAVVPFVHSVNFYTLSVSFGRPGVLKHVVDSYLMADGSRFTDIPGHEKMEWYEESQNRDPRLSQTIKTPGYTRIGETKTTLPDFASAITGYQYIKYVQSSQFDQGNCVNDMPIFRYAEVLLNYAEAKAELGTLTQQDLDLSVRHLRDRVGMPNISLEKSNANPDPFLADQYRGVNGANKGIILEIRRERRIELIREGHRWHDIIRWKEGQLLTRTFKGMYFPGTGTYDLDKDGTIDLQIFEGARPPLVPGRQYIQIGEVVFENGANGGNIITNPTVQKTWDENKDYLYPIPTQERILNPNLTQNPGWVDGI